MDIIMTFELIPQLEPIPTWNRLHQWLFWPVESLWNRLQKNWNRNISITQSQPFQHKSSHLAVGISLRVLRVQGF